MRARVTKAVTSPVTARSEAPDRVDLRLEVLAGLVPTSVFKTDGAPRKRRRGGFDSRALPPRLRLAVELLELVNPVDTRLAGNRAVGLN